ncbi:uncharacterized protein LOC124834530 [Vigna umbellata]|nr:uncharacterized protein LOC124834530 [Vigna umbellata]
MPQLYKHFHVRSTPRTFSPSFSLSLSLTNTFRSLKRRIMKGKFLRGCLNKWKKVGSRVIQCGAYGYCCEWEVWPWMQNEGESDIPNDVPKGHLVVYVGEHHKRYVIKITLLHHPLFKTLLDQAQDEYDFIADSKLYIPCTEHLFLTVLRCATSPHNQRLSLCV